MRIIMHLDDSAMDHPDEQECNDGVMVLLLLTVLVRAAAPGTSNYGIYLAAVETVQNV